MISEQTYRANYFPDDFYDAVKWIAKPVRICESSALLREFRELEDLLDSGVGDSDKIEDRMHDIWRELLRRSSKLD